VILVLECIGLFQWLLVLLDIDFIVILVGTKKYSIEYSNARTQVTLGRAFGVSEV
jgi:hypothetical protein